MSSSLAATVWADHRLAWGQRTYVMGIVNVTPDSFSGDGLGANVATEEALVQRAIAQAQRFVAEGATFLDIGGESTRPRALSISVEQELARVVPVIKALRKVIPPQIIISIDTYKAEVAAIVQKHGVPVVLMANMLGYHKREIVSDVIRFLSSAIDHALAAGIAWEHIIVDPGIGFGTTPEENLILLRRLGELRVLGRPILLGNSRKSTIGRVLGGLPVSERLEGTAASVALGIAQGVDIVRVHDVHEMMRVVKMSDAIVRGTFELSPL